MEVSNQILSEITVYTKYARYIDAKDRRETWEELVTRNMSMHIKKYPQLEAEIREVYKFVYSKSIFPSMRSLQFGGKPIEISPNRIYNCAYLPIDDWHAFGESMFLLLGGTGVGYSVQKHHVDSLPEIHKPNPNNIKRYLINDSIEGWADAIKHLMKSYFKGGTTHKFDYSDIRDKGARLVTSGGKAPGAEPLKKCLETIREILDNKENGQKLSPVEAHDILCHIADAVLAGGIRRAAMIALFSATDNDMLTSKTNFRVLEWTHLLEEGPVDEQGEPVKVHAIHTDEKGNKYWDLTVSVDEPGYGIQEKTLYWVGEEEMAQLQDKQTLPWYYFQPQRGRANNSVSLLRSRITKKKFNELWKTIEDSGAGEPGFYFTNDKDWGTNPCCEIALRPYQFCNLCEVNVSNVTSQEDLEARVKAAAFIGTLQAGYTDFHYLRKVWQKTTEKDALIGVGMTGIGSNKVLGLDLESAANVVKVENERVAKILGIKKAARTTTVKPSGTSSLVAGSSSGIHAWHNDYYIRRMRIGKNEAIYSYLSIHHPDLIEDDFFRPFDTAVLSVPQKAPKGSILRHESSLDLLERVKLVKETWIDAGHRDGMNTHNISATISLKDDEWEEIGEWMWKNRSSYNGLSVLPYNGGTYKQAPFEDCTEYTYKKMMKSLHEVDLTKIVETTDETDLQSELACAGGACEVK
tara:strand:- start:2794 stop:4866 length:2073 start_codon:yes stop_codon:yes gene_type:complete